MRNRKLLYVLIPLIIVALILVVGVIYLKLNSGPEKIFEHSINKVFSLFESSEEQVSTMKGTMNLTADIESENEQMQAINTMLEGTSIGLDMGMDTTNMVINENLKVTVNNESLLNAAIILQDQKGYVYLKDYLDKYLELPEEYMEYSELTEYYEKLETLDQNALMDAIKEELIKSISIRDFTKDKIQKTKVSKLDLTQEEFYLLSKEILEGLKQNEKFNNALGEFKDEVMVAIDDIREEFAELEYNKDARVIISIFTEGLFNNFVGFSIELKEYEDIVLGMMFARGEAASEFVVYEQNGDEKEEHIKARIEDRKESKDKGTATITMTVDEEQFVVTYNYEKQGGQTSFVLSTKIEGVGISFSGNAIEDGKNVKGNFVISVEENTFGKANLNCTYDFTYDVVIQKVDTQNAVLIDELSEEDLETFMTNIKKSPLYQLVEQFGLMDSESSTLSNEPEVTYGGYTVKYINPEGFEMSEYSSTDFKIYTDENSDSINITIENESVDTYMSDLDNEYILTSDLYENQKISDTKVYTINGKEYKYRTISYNLEDKLYAKLYFAYELDDEYCYVVEVESGGAITMDIIKQFLDVTVEKANMFYDI